jgi:predicted ATP-grasp superfamily ATP-dependent carboligase
LPFAVPPAGQVCNLPCEQREIASGNTPKAMRIFVYEYLCSRSPPDAPASLLREGRAMLSAVLADLGRCPGVEVETLLAPALLATPWPPNVTPHAAPLDEEALFRTLAAAADVSLLIVPEFDGLLAARCRQVEEAGGRLLGPSGAAVRLTADKLALARHLLDRGVPTPPTSLPPLPLALSFPVVCKPRDGAGSQATFLAANEHALNDCIDSARREGWNGELIVQPYVPGEPVSVAFLVGPGRQLALPAVRQHLSRDGRFHYLGGGLPLSADLAGRATDLAGRAVRAVEGLHGYVGVDLVLGGTADGSTDRVLEINPRLTTSYVGYRALAEFNLAEALLAVATARPLPEWKWKSGPVEFT